MDVEVAQQKDTFKTTEDLCNAGTKFLNKVLIKLGWTIY